ncbi:MOB kinase activator-like 2 isoform X3 [Scaptodrosophila lebanonensis]|uniref:MOB kinase activator-like 2 n=1 Tax=Drosophila lebanonensis TaxID=7225 RepID=A0A6J2T832_DROLE|nr:MOB kinase activator-like 2 isoform X3 [Scaptodrosophila lebanonensis]XP_030372151.1 MOB kinase activator-like 2 isoform X3 [Scaptodrosophila lebanonensis]
MNETLNSKVPRITKTTTPTIIESETKSKRKSKQLSASSASSLSLSLSSSETTSVFPPPNIAASSSAPTSYVIKCLLKTARFMWQVTTIPAKIGETIGTLYRYAQDSVDSFLCVAGKARRKERDGDQNSTDTKLYLEESVLERKLPEADLKALVDLPAGLDYNEWLASHTLALFEHVNLVYGTISEFCTQSGCADMTGPGNRTYLWFDEKGKKTRVAAPQYIDYVMTFTQKTVSDESIFPTKYANEFPGSFESIARKILRLQFHVIAHLYAAHFREIALLGLHTHLNLTFAHLTALHRRFNLIDEKETDVLRDLEVALRLTDDSTNGSSGSGGGGGGGGGGSGGGGGGSGDHASSTNVAMSTQESLAPGGEQHNNSSSNTSSASTTLEHVNSQSNNSHTASLIDGDAVAPPICTQPEAGLMGGILGDLTSGEFGDTTRYCTSAVPQAAHADSAAQAIAAAAAAAAAATTTTLNNGAGALNLNYSNNNNNNHNLNHLNHLNHHHHPHHHHHGHHGHHHHHHGVAAAAAAAAGALAASNNTSSTTTSTTTTA